MCSFFQKKKNLFKDLLLFTLRKKRNFTKAYSFLPIAILVWLSVRGKYYLQCILHMKETVPDALKGQNIGYGKGGIFPLFHLNGEQKSPLGKLALGEFSKMIEL